MRKLNCCIIVLSFLLAACMSEVKPILKPTQQLDIPARIADEQKWVDEAVASKALTFKEARPVQEKLYQIKVKYNTLLSTGKLTAKDCDAINQMLDECSDLLFRIEQKKRRNY